MKTKAALARAIALLSEEDSVQLLKGKEPIRLQVRIEGIWCDLDNFKFDECPQGNVLPSYDERVMMNAKVEDIAAARILVLRPQWIAPKM